MEGLDGRTIVFGGAGGIATAVAGLLGASGANVVVGDVREDNAALAVKEAAAAGGDGRATALDIADEASVRDLAELALDSFGRIDGLFNVAAYIGPARQGVDSNAVDIDLGEWQRAIDVNLTGYLLTTRYCVPHILRNGGGAVVNTMSGAAFSGEATRVAYSATKAAVGALTRHTAVAVGKQGLRANAVAPGLVSTASAIGGLKPEFREAVLDRMALGRFGEPRDMATIVGFLLSDQSSWLTGQCISVDGGASFR